MFYTFKAYIDPDKGPARGELRLRKLEGIKTYDKYLDEFRKHFDQMGILVKYLHMQRKGDETDIDIIDRLDDFIKYIENNLRGTACTINGHPNQITIENLNPHDGHNNC
ncbi:hypothetical protein E2C01_047733 [Portunus trituberculatus]|uniref:Uncharacterized protein n=1 Tax=Portunus trituberculatus TaxID=210409 RepID=A0A5B7G1V4_PORTR|nr:hypothetical protein [Portunus trituberculatus]